jgi:hypothetical protein
VRTYPFKPGFTLDFESIPMVAGTLLFIRKHRVLMYDRSQGYNGLVLRFTGSLFPLAKAD